MSQALRLETTAIQREKNRTKMINMETNANKTTNKIYAWHIWHIGAKQLPTARKKINFTNISLHQIMGVCSVVSS